MDYQNGQNNSEQHNYNNSYNSDNHHNNSNESRTSGYGTDHSNIYGTGANSYGAGTNSYGSSDRGTYQYNANGYGTGNYGTGSYGTGGYNQGSAPLPKKKKSGIGLAGTVALCMAASLVVGTAGGALGATAVNYFDENMQSGSRASLQTSGADSQAAESDLAEGAQEAGASATASTTGSATAMSVGQIAEVGLPSVVAITNKGETEIRSMWGTFTQESQSSGSGVIIGQTDSELLIVTNYHVVEGNEELSVLFSYQEDSEDSQIASAKIKDYIPNKDLAVIAIDMSALTQDTLDNINVATIGDSEKLGLGEQVVAIGNALGYGQSVTTGVISALNRTITLQSETGNSTVSNAYLQTDAAINPGNSGGALFNMYGELVGINSAKVAAAEVEGMGYSIPITDVKSDIENMMNAETRDVVAEDNRGYLGISGSNVSAEISQSYDIPEGAYISAVTEGSPAERAGLSKGMVITAMNGKSVSTITELSNYLSYYASGETVTLTVKVRGAEGYTEQQMDVTLGTMQQAIPAQESQSGGLQGNSQNGSSGQTSPYGQFGGNGNSIFDYFGQGFGR